MSIRDKVAIIGMGCSQFGERWDCGPQQLAQEAFGEALADAQISSDQIGAAWVGTTNPELGLGRSGLGISTALGLAEQMALTRPAEHRRVVLAGTTSRR